ncbi:ATP-binding cassette domain-containing protein [Roseicella aerolata]|uniref:ATP-binding cassette domain-containing protein n=1 Tax=Roseicella aerolata TaxID=2883479 RepID=A0A9X1IFD5_9PROT|nr:ATP-binding cassette domain-containing protein [Roseicella aerolata]
MSEPPRPGPPFARPGGGRCLCARAVAARIIRRIGLRGFEDHWPRQLSGGRQQRRALARAQASALEILLQDEPSGALKARLMAEIREEVRLAAAGA